MKRSCCNPPHPLIRGGTSGPERTPPALSPSTVPLDDRGLADLLAWCLSYSRLLAFHQVPAGKDETIVSGSWEPLIRADASVLLSEIARFDISNQYEAFREMSQRAEEDPDKTVLHDVLEDLGQQALDLARRVTTWRDRAVDGLAARRVIEGAIRSELRVPVQRIQGYDFGADNTGDVESLDLDYGNLLDHQELWELEIPATDGTIPQGDPTIYEGKEAGRFHLERAVERVGSLYERMHGVVLRLVQQAPAWLAETLSWPEHEPHLALLITFLRLFRHAQARLNRLPREHLDFYYERVLGLIRRPAEPDRVHLIFALANQVTGAKLLDAGTLFKGGKDADGIEQIYRLEEDVSLSRAQVADIRALYIARATEQTSFHVSPEAASRDGKGADFEDGEEERWKTFGQDDTRDSPATAPGLAIASPLLFLAEGTRTIKVTMTVGGPVEAEVVDAVKSLREAFHAASAPSKNPPFTAHISTTEGWHDLGSPSPTEEAAVVSDKEVIQIEYTLPTEAPPAVAKIDDKTPAHEYPTPYPVLRLVVNGESGEQLYESLSKLELRSVDLTVEVEGLYGLHLENDTGALQSGKPVPVFGSTPVTGSSLYIGHFELFCKDIQSVEVAIEWLDKPDFSKHYQGYSPVPSDDDFTLDVDALDTREHQRWITLALGEQDDKTAPIPLFPKKKKILIDAEDQSRNLDLEAFSPRLGDSAGGFLRLRLEWDFLHSKFQATYTRAVLALAQPPVFQGTAETASEDVDDDEAKSKGVSAAASALKSATALGLPSTRKTESQAVSAAAPVLPNPPWTPVAASISLDYTTTASLSPGETPPDPDEKRPGEQFFHLHPFGFEEIRESSAPPTLLPRYQVKDRVPADLGETIDLPLSGALYLGISDHSDAARNLSLFFQVAEGSADPQVPEPPTITWSYLKDNEWENFEQGEILADRTDGLVRSGIITLALPAVENLDHTVMPEDLYWIRAAVSRDPDGICDLYEVRAQAGVAVFEDPSGANAESHYEAPLVAGSIQKLVPRDSEIAAVEQLYASFGARVKERDDEFYRRISERLRHKDRAIALWDYERLVLEEFPAVYRVKCLPHTDSTSELAPGSVQVVVVADVENQNEVNPFEPRASQALRDAIADFLRSRVSPWVVDHLEVVNPRYERISTKSQVSFQPGVDTGIHKTKLAQAIREFLAPWAFKVGAEVAFGGRLHSSAIVNFIDEQPYVDAVLDFQMFQHIPGEDTTEMVPVVEAEASTAGSILVAHPVQEIEVVEPAATTSTSPPGSDSWSSSLSATPGPTASSSSSASPGPNGSAVDDSLSALAAPSAEPRDEDVADPDVDDLFTPPALPREPFDSLTVDAWGLRTEGTGHLQRLAGRTWTDHNVHDPGITILDVLCFALTDVAFRARHDRDSMERLLATPPPETGDPVPAPQFFTAQTVLTSHPVTENDFRKLLIDCDGVRNAWLEPTPESERDLFLRRSKKKIKHYAREEHEATVNVEEPIHLDGLYRIYLELEKDPELGDLNDERVTATLDLPEPDGATSRHRLDVHFVRGISGTLPLDDAPFLDSEDWSAENPFWDQLLDLDLSGPPSDFGLIANETMEGDIRFDLGDGTGLFLEFRLESGEGGFDLSARYDDVDAAFRANAFECLVGVLRDYQSKVRRRLEIVSAVRSRLQAHRPLCEDFLSIHGMRVEEIGICVDVELVPEADVSEVQARIEFAVARALSPEVGFFSLQELRDAGVPTEEIFNGPRLQHGFIDNSALEGRGRTDVIHASDLIQIMMDVAGVQAVQKLLMSNYVDDEPKTLGATWELELAEPMRRVPRFSASKSRFLFYKGLVPFFSDAEEVHRILGELEIVERRGKQLLGDIDIAVPTAEYRDLQEYTSIQTHFPLVYGIGEEGLGRTADAARHAQAKQLKAYLLFFDQLLADSLAQLARFKDLFSVNGRPDRTRFALPLDQVPRGEELFLSHDDYPDALGEITEDDATFDRRRNGFLDHLLARFGERFGEYARIVRDFRGLRAGSILIRDKQDFLRDFPSIGYRRGLGFNTSVFSDGDCPSEHNVSGFRRRVGALLGVREDPHLDSRFQQEEFPQTFEIYLDNEKKWRFRIVFHDLGPDKVLKDVTGDDEPQGAAEQLMHLTKAGALSENYQIEEAQNEKYYLKIRGPQGLIAWSSDAYARRTDASALRSRLVELFERELGDPTIDSFTYWFEEEEDRWSFLIIVEEGLAVESVDRFDDALSARKALRDTLLVLRNRSKDRDQKDRIQIEKLSDDRFGITIRDEKNEELGRSSSQYDSKAEAEKQLDKVKEFVAAHVGARLGFSPENFFVLEHLLLRPRQEGDRTVRIAHRRECDVVEKVDAERLDPYSFRASVVLPGEAPRFADTVFRAFVEDTLRREAPAHVSLKICWVNHDQLLEFEDAYCRWREELARPTRVEAEFSLCLKRVIKILERLRSIYPQATLHDCRDPSAGRPVILGHSSLGELKND